MATKQQKKAQKAQAKIEKKPAQLARKTFGKQSNPRLALEHLQKAQRNFVALPPILWPLVAIVAFMWARNTYEKEQSARAIAEAREFLKHSRDIRI